MSNAKYVNAQIEKVRLGGKQNLERGHLTIILIRCGNDVELVR